MDIQTLREKRAALMELAARRGAHHMRVFGSVARGEAEEGSDVDLLVEFDPDRSAFDLAALRQDFEEYLGVPVDLATEKGLKEAVRSEVLRESVAL